MKLFGEGSGGKDWSSSPQRTEGHQHFFITHVPEETQMGQNGKVKGARGRGKGQYSTITCTPGTMHHGGKKKSCVGETRRDHFGPSRNFRQVREPWGEGRGSEGMRE